jgi:hypothetical protein
MPDHFKKTPFSLFIITRNTHKYILNRKKYIFIRSRWHKRETQNKLILFTGRLANPLFASFEFSTPSVLSLLTILIQLAAGAVILTPVLQRQEKSSKHSYKKLQNKR